jgi:hypothetical protein
MSIPSVQPHVFYHGNDRRMNLCELNQLPDEEKKKDYPGLDKIKDNFSAVACLMKSNQLDEKIGVDGGSYYSLSNNVRTLNDVVKNTVDERIKDANGVPLGVRFGVPLADDEKYQHELAPGFGTAFLIGKKKLLTAGHCICDLTTSALSPLNTIRVVFGFYRNENDADRRHFGQNEVYEIKKVLKHSFNHRHYAKDYTGPRDPDWALIKLKRNVVGITPIKLSGSFD